MQKEILNTSAALNMLSGETDLYKMLIDAFISESPSNLDTIDQLIGEGKNEEARAYSHKIKGSASQIGAEQLTFALQYLEDGLKGSMMADVSALSHNASYVYKRTISYIKEYRQSL
ncbi:MAG: Hpt domain-containing protein [Treponema sp.]|nr:Hpt domain-containing protein [Treponema sp.]